MAKRTPFYPKHKARGARLVEFAGFELPMQFKGVISEHLRVRSGVGVFDVSHMGRIEIFGPDALQCTNWLLTNDLSRTEPFQALYSALCYPDGGIVDDLVVYNLEDRYLLVVNAANTEKDYEWILKNKKGRAESLDRTAELAQLAVQGPKAEPLMQRLTNFELSRLKYYWSARAEVCGVAMLISRTGYTGEDGFELYFDAQDGSLVWDRLFKAGQDFELEPIGLGARDTLRLEMGYRLYGNDIDASTNPLEAGLGWITKLEKPDGFVGQDALKELKAQGLNRKLVGFEMAGSEIPRPGYLILISGNEVGRVTSGTYSPSLKKGIGMGYLPVELTSEGAMIEILIRDRTAPALVIKLPFYKEASHK
jgi:aminomethyltransferase